MSLLVAICGVVNNRPGSNNNISKACNVLKNIKDEVVNTIGKPSALSNKPTRVQHQKVLKYLLALNFERTCEDEPVKNMKTGFGPGVFGA